jgi:hypothetical protein
MLIVHSFSKDVFIQIQLIITQCDYNEIAAVCFERLRNWEDIGSGKIRGVLRMRTVASLLRKVKQL